MLAMSIGPCESATRWRQTTLTVATLLVGCGAGQLDGYAPLTIFDNFRVIEEGRAYRSAQLDGQTLALVFETCGIRTVINLRGENEQEPWYQNEQAATERAGVTLVDIPMSAATLPSRDALLRLYDTFLTAEYPILIHCQSGADRTGAAAAIWRMVVGGEPRQAAMTELSPLYGHFPARYPAMDELVRIFQPSREWIEEEYSPTAQPDG